MASLEMQLGARHFRTVGGQDRGRGAAVNGHREGGEGEQEDGEEDEFYGMHGGSVG
eukprot:CAMPEP_0184713478 /NCGR_PEP_ID=MMETSP0314-20130426/3812_1 /TAXON_ID=38298 /ORGANISM="Rhodella maculata, Strain CCMP 736" /LENGTH=55 /DNA_ID=CAMNT_0027176143 /DNA_START=144 /DNA_END=310 /DNA_ORIENTATION=-